MLQKLKQMNGRFSNFRKMVRRRLLFNTTVIAITGSCGKTSTTHFLDKILSSTASCSTGIHFNGYRRIRKTISRTKLFHKFLIQEVGVSDKNQMVHLATLLKPDIGVVTNIGLDHYSAFRTREAAATEKGLLISSLSHKGTAILNMDDPLVMAMANGCRGKIITYGLHPDADLKAEDVEYGWPKRLSFTAHYNNKQIRIHTLLFSDILLTSLLAAIAASLSVGVPLTQAASILQGAEGIERRQTVHGADSGIWFINDTFKASFWSVSQCIKALKKVSAPRVTLIMGSMSDISGSVSPKYRAIAKEYLQVCDRVIFVGKTSQYVQKLMSDELSDRLFIFPTVKEAREFLQKTAMKDELIYLKSSNRPHLERLIYHENPDHQCWIDDCIKQTDCANCRNRMLSDRQIDELR